MKDKIVIQDLSKFYGRKQALRDIQLNIQPGVFGLLGQNGAGKTTLMKILTTLLPKTSGDVSICDTPIHHAKEIRNLVGYLPQDFSMYPNMSVYEAMDYLGTLAGLRKSTRKERIPMLLEKVNLQNNQRTRVKALSGGMKRRLGIAQALLNDPRVIIVDEPTAGLDPEERVRFRNLFTEMAKDRIVLLSTHIVGDIEATCESIAILEQGSILYNGKLIDLLKQAQGKIFTASISRIELEELKKDYAVTGMLAQDNSVLVRFIDPSGKSFKGARACDPNAEDAYLTLLHEKRGEMSC